MGDILFAVANLARKLDIDPEAALRRATAKFERRFRLVEALAAERGVGKDLDALETLWREAKLAEAEENLTRLKEAVSVRIQRTYNKVERTGSMLQVALEEVALRKESERLAGNQSALGVVRVSARQQASA